MLRKTRFGYADFPSESLKKRRKIEFNSSKESDTLDLRSIEEKLDILLLHKEKLALIEDDFELDRAYIEFLHEQSSVVDLLTPILDRLADLGAFVIEYNPDWGQIGDQKKIEFWAETGYSTFRGYQLSGSKLDLITDPPPPLIGFSEDGKLEL